MWCGDALEQDLKAALQKLKKQRRTGSVTAAFPYRESPFVRQQNPGKRKILYLESMRHEIWVHCEKEGVPDVGNARILGGKAARQVVFYASTKVFWSIPGRSAGLKGNDRAGGWQPGFRSAATAIRKSWRAEADPACGISGVRQRVNQNREERENNGRDEFRSIICGRNFSYYKRARAAGIVK